MPSSDCSAEGRRRISFFPFVFRYAAVLKRERKNLPPMMQEREKDWSRRPVFAQAKSRQNIKESKTTLNLFFGKKHPVSLQALV